MRDKNYLAPNIIYRINKNELIIHKARNIYINVPLMHVNISSHHGFYTRLITPQIRNIIQIRSLFAFFLYFYY